MGGLFSKPKSPKVPPVPPPQPIPQKGEEVGDYAQRAARKRAGFQRTIMTGNLEPIPGQGKRLLGG